MASTRSYATRTLRHLPRANRQTRQLHLTPTGNLPVRIAAADKQLFQEHPHTTVSSVQADDFVRAFSTSDSSYDSPSALRPTAPADRMTIGAASTPTPFSPSNQTRHFNTSRALKRVGDSSTMDFAYLPSFSAASADDLDDRISVPLVPWNFTPQRSDAPSEAQSQATDDDVPSISTIAADSTHISAPSAMTDVHDAGGHLLDFHEVAETLTSAARKVTLGTDREGGEEARRSKGLLKQVWTGMLDDIFGQKTQKT